MSTTAVYGKNAAAFQPIWAIQAADLPGITESTTSIPLTAVTAGQKLDCYLNFGAFTLERTPTTQSRQRMCQAVAEEIKIGETIAGSANIAADQQLPDTDTVNLAYAAFPEGAQVYIFIAHGWAQDQTPTVATKGDLWRIRVSQVDRLIAADPGDELAARVTLTGDLFIPDVTLTA